MADAQNTRIPAEAFRGHVFYDGACEFCIAAARRFGPRLERRGFSLVPFQTAWVCERTGLTDRELAEEMRLLTADGALLCGIDAHAHLARSIWWARPFAVAVRISVLRPLLRKIYRLIADHRYGLHARYGAWLVVAVLLALAGLSGSWMPAWAWMWALSAALFIGFKALTWSGIGDGSRRTLRSTLTYFVAWPGMDPRVFFKPAARPPRQPTRDWMNSTITTLVGAGLMWIAVPMIVPRSSYAAGAIGFVGMIMMLHFGLFHLLAMFWRRRGRDVRPIMDRPWRAASLSEFWGRRWNVAFRQVVHRDVFRPLARRWGTVSATLATFAVSGLIHDLVISVPARGGYGGPTAYFVLQGLALLIERSRTGLAIGLDRPGLGRLFAAAVVLAPIGLLFHAAFMERVFVPFLHAIAIKGG